jgi:hypothetical protein
VKYEQKQQNPRSLHRSRQGQPRPRRETEADPDLRRKI